MKFNINLESLEDFLSHKTCNHTFKHTFEWAAKNDLPKEAIEELANELDVHSDIELAEIIGDIGDSFEVELEAKSAPASNAWMIPSDFVIPPSDKVYYQVIVSPSLSETGLRCYANPEEILLPAPIGYKPIKKMRKVWHFFVGLHSGLPSEVGIIKSHPPLTAPAFLEMVKESHLAGFEAFDLPIAFFYLEQAAKMAIDHGVGVHFLEEFGNAGKFTRIRITRRLL